MTRSASRHSVGVLANVVQGKVVDGLVSLGPAAAAARRLRWVRHARPQEHAARGGPIIRAAYGDATGRIHLIAAVVPVVALDAVALIKEVPPRTTVTLEQPPEARVTEMTDTVDNVPVIPADERPADRRIRRESVSV